MEQGTIIFLAVLILVIAIPIIITNSKKRKKEKILLNQMNELAQKSNCQISNFQHWKNFQIGIDQQKGKLFFIRNTQDNESLIEVDLSQVQNVRVLKAERMVSTGNAKYTTVDKVDLTFNLRNSKSDIILNFYNSSFDSPTIQGELQVAEKWKEIANAWISANNRKS